MKQLRQRAFMAVLLFLVSSLLVGNSSKLASAATSYNGIDPTIPVRYAPLPKCQTSTELDCFESFKVVHPDGTQESPTDYPMFTYHDGSIKGPIIHLPFNVTVTTPSQWNIQKQVGFDIPVLIVHADESVMSKANPGDHFTLTVRTSWLIPLNVYGFARNSTVSDAPIPGGHRWTFSGQQASMEIFNPDHQSWYSDLGVAGAPLHAADQEITGMYWNTTHVSSIPNGSAFDTSCSENGYTVTSSNASSAGMPQMIGPETLSYNVYAPHFKADAKTVTEGFLQVSIPLAWLDCKWPGNTLSKATKVEVSVTDSDGSTEIATTAAQVENGRLEVKVSGFHFSAPTISIRPASSDNQSPKPVVSPRPTVLETPKPTPTTAISSPAATPKTPKATTITCYKGKLLKKVTALNPKCPAGYQLRK